jgi:hypothetical protein
MNFYRYIYIFFFVLHILFELPNFYGRKNFKTSKKMLAVPQYELFGSATDLRDGPTSLSNQCDSSCGPHRLQINKLILLRKLLHHHQSTTAESF